MASETVLFDSCDPCRQKPRWFQVGGGCSCLIKSAGLPEGVEIPLLMWVGDSSGSCGEWVPAKDLNGDPVVITSDLCVIHVTLPCRYTLDVSQIEFPKDHCDKSVPCVKVSKEKVTPAEHKAFADIKFLPPLPTYTLIPTLGSGCDTFLCQRYDAGCRLVTEYVTFDVGPEGKPIVATQSTIGSNAAKNNCVFLCKSLEFTEGPVTPASVLALLVGAGLTYSDGTLVAATDAVNSAVVNLIPENGHTGPLDAPVITTTCDATVECPAGSGIVVNLDPGGSSPVGNPDAVGQPADFEILLEAGSAVRVDVVVSRCGPEGSAQPFDPNA